MSSIVLTSAVRQNLLALQDTAAMMATTQNDLSTGKKVNTALDNPTNFFTASGLDNRAGDISNLLDGISNGVQVLQAADAGITSLQSLVSQAKSIANQALQSSIGYSTKASTTSGNIPGATSANLFGTPASETLTGTAAVNGDTSANGGLLQSTSSLTHSASVDSVATALTAGTDNLVVNGKTISFSASSSNSITSNGATISISNGTVGDVINAINTITGTTTASINNTTGVVTLNTGTTGLTISGTTGILGDLGLGAASVTSSAGAIPAVTGITATPTTVTGPTPVSSGQTLLIPVSYDGTTTTASVTFGTGTGQVSTLDQLNAALASSDLQATLNSVTGQLTISTSNDAASGSIGPISGTSTATGKVFNALASGYSLTAAPTQDPTSQATRASLVSQYNAILSQITNTAQDSSYNGINLLAGDQLQLTFNETGKSKVNITGTDFSAAGLGLASLTQGTDFIDNASTNNVLSTLNTVSANLRAQASTFGSNLSVVQTRQDFNKNLINVLQTGSANLTQADINEEAANSQALSTRQSLSVSALSLANQAQQSVLQLLR